MPHSSWFVPCSGKEELFQLLPFQRSSTSPVGLNVFGLTVMPPAQALLVPVTTRLSRSPAVEGTDSFFHVLPVRSMFSIGGPPDAPTASRVLPACPIPLNSPCTPA